MISETYRDIEINYDIERNKWVYSVNGRERGKDSLLLARENIDKTLDAVKKDPKAAFERFNAYHRESSYGKGETFSLVEITSLAEDRSRFGNSEPEFWTMRNGAREKVPQKALIAITPENDALIAKLKDYRISQKQIEKEIESTLAAMTRVEIPKAS